MGRTTIDTVLKYVKERLDSDEWRGKWDPNQGVNVYLSTQYLFPRSFCHKLREENTIAVLGTCADHDNHLHLVGGIPQMEPHPDGSPVAIVDTGPDECCRPFEYVIIFFDEPLDPRETEQPREYWTGLPPDRLREMFDLIGVRRGTEDTEPLRQLPIEI